MRRFRFIAVLALSVLAVGTGIFGLYWYGPSFDFWGQSTGTSSQQQVESEPPDDIDVQLPSQLQEQTADDDSQRMDQFERAIRAHNQERFDPAAELYQEVIEQSPPDRYAALSYRYLADIYSRIGQLQRAARLYGYAIDIQPDQANHRYRLARVHEQLGNLDRAVSAYNKAIELNSTDDYYVALGNHYFERDQNERAVEIYRQGLNSVGDESRLWANLGLALKQLNQTSDALEALNKAMTFDLDPDRQYRLLNNIGQLLLTLDRPADAVERFNQARKLSQTADIFYNLAVGHRQQTQWQNVIENLNKANELTDSSDILIDLGFAHEQIQQYEQASKWYERAIESEPDRTKLYWSAGRMRERAGQDSRALGHYRRLTRRLEGDPGPLLARVWRRVGELYLDQGQPEHAAPAFRNSLKIDPDHPDIQFNLGLAYRRTDQLDRAIDQFRDAVDRRPDELQYRHLLGRTLFEFGNRKQARSQFQEISAREPSNVQAGYFIGYIDYSWGKLKQARDRFDSLLDRTSSPGMQAKLAQNLGLIFARLDKPQQAERHFRRSLDKQETVTTFYNLGLFYMIRREWDKARRSFDFGLEIDDRDADLHAARGLSLYRKGLLERAERSLQRALELDPDNLRAQYDLNQLQNQRSESS